MFAPRSGQKFQRQMLKFAGISPDYYFQNVIYVSALQYSGMRRQGELVPLSSICSSPAPAAAVFTKSCYSRFISASEQRE